MKDVTERGVCVREETESLRNGTTLLLTVYSHLTISIMKPLVACEEKWHETKTDFSFFF